MADNSKAVECAWCSQNRPGKPAFLKIDGIWSDKKNPEEIKAEILLTSGICPLCKAIEISKFGESADAYDSAEE